MTREQAEAEYVRTHWGNRGARAPRSLRVADPSEVYFAVLGDLVSITYRTAKGRLALVEDFEHDFLKPRPVLCYSPKSKFLIIAGGGYTVTAKGIEK